MTENERTIERGDVRVSRGPEGCLAASVQDVPLWIGYLHPQTARDLLAAASAALGDEVVCVSRERLRAALMAAWDAGDAYLSAGEHSPNFPGEGGADVDTILTRLTAAPAGTEREE